MTSREISSPLKLLDCCPVSDGGAAFIVSRDPVSDHHVRVLGCGQAHLHQHVTATRSLSDVGAAVAMNRARDKAGVDVRDIKYAGIYDSFTITLAILIEELGLAPRGESAARARSGDFGIGGAMAHLVETQLQMTGRAGPRQARDASIALLHGDGGVMSSHVSLFLERVR